MNASNSSVYREWYERGKKDIEDAELLLNEGGHLENVAFFIQQAIEKYLKGYLIGQGWTLQRGHDLEWLLDQAISHDSSFSAFDSFCQMVTEYYFDSRYPDSLSTGYTKQEVRQALNKAKQLIALILSLLPA